MANQGESLSNSNNQGLQSLPSQDGTNLHSQSPVASINARPHIDLNQPYENPNLSSNDCNNSGEGDGESRGADGRRSSFKRKSPEEPSFIGESSRSRGETSRLISRDSDQQQEEEYNINVDDSVGYFVPEIQGTHILDSNVDNQQRQQRRQQQQQQHWGPPGPVVLGLAAPTQLDRQNHQRQTRMAQVAEANAMWHQGVSYATPPSRVTPQFVEHGLPSYWNNNTYMNMQSPWGAHVISSPSFTAPVQYVPGQGNVNGSYGHIIPDGAITYPDYSIQQLGFSVTAANMSSGLIITQQNFRPPIVQMHPLIRAQREMADRAAADRHIHEVRDTIALIRNVMGTVQTAAYGGNEELGDVVYGGNEDIADDQEPLNQGVNDVYYEDNTNGSGLTEVHILEYLKHIKYDSASSSINDDTCCICQEEYKNGEDVSIVHCGHRYHYECIKEWLFGKNICPICKRTAIQ